MRGVGRSWLTHQIGTIGQLDATIASALAETARQMVLRWGMSEKRVRSVSSRARKTGCHPSSKRSLTAEATSELIDAEVRRIVEECHAEADRLLTEHRDKLEALAEVFLKAESLDEREIREVTGLGEPSRSTRPSPRRQPSSTPHSPRAGAARSATF